MDPHADISFLFVLLNSIGVLLILTERIYVVLKKANHKVGSD